MFLVLSKTAIKVGPIECVKHKLMRKGNEIPRVTDPEVEFLGVGSCGLLSSIYLDVITANSNADLSEVLEK